VSFRFGIVTNVIVLIKGNTPLMYGCAGGHEEVVRVLLNSGANVEDHNENGHTPLMEAASAGHVPVAKILLEHGAGINTHSNEFKESALTLACYKGHLEMVRFLLEAGADQVSNNDCFILFCTMYSKDNIKWNRVRSDLSIYR